MEQSVKNASPTSNDLAYVAGFFDGEGHIRIQKHSTRCDSTMLSVTCVQATEFPLDRFIDFFGGTLKLRKMKYKGGTRRLYTWQTSSAQAEKFLRAIYPFLIVKKDEADIAFEYRKTFRPMHVVQSDQYKKLDRSIVSARNVMHDQLMQVRKDKRLLAYA